jgi:hypothetical protein
MQKALRIWKREKGYFYGIFVVGVIISLWLSSKDLGFSGAFAEIILRFRESYVVFLADILPMGSEKAMAKGSVFAQQISVFPRLQVAGAGHPLDDLLFRI